MNYKPYVSWGMYGGTSATERANFFSSWGLMESLAARVSISMINWGRMR